MTPKSQKPFNESARSDGILIALYKSGRNCVLPVDQICRLSQDSDGDIAVSTKDSTYHFSGNFEVFMHCYLAARMTGGVYDLRDACNVRSEDRLYRPDLATTRDQDTVAALKRRVRRLEPSDFAF